MENTNFRQGNMTLFDIFPLDSRKAGNWRDLPGKTAFYRPFSTNLKSVYKTDIKKRPSSYLLPGQNQKILIKKHPGWGAF